MSLSFDVTSRKIGGNTIKIWVHVEADGSLSVDDYSYGTAADAFYGRGRGVELSLTLRPDAVRKLYGLLADRVDPNPAEKLAKLLTKKFAGDIRALSKIRELCDRRKITYGAFSWIESA